MNDMLRRLEELDLQPGDMVISPGRNGWDWECTPLIFVGIQVGYYHLYVFMHPAGSMKRFFGSSELVVISRVKDALG